MKANSAYFPTCAKLGFVVFNNDEYPELNFVQNIDLSTI